MKWRSFLVVAAFLVVGGGIALEFAARNAAADMSQSLEPFATLTYSSAGIAFDGSVRLQEPRLEIHSGFWPGKVKARVVEVRGSGTLWLLWRALSGADGIPEDLLVQTHGLLLGPAVGGGPVLDGWMGTSDLVVFENLGCGSDALGDKDRLRMGVDTREREDVFRFNYDSVRRSFNASLKLRSEEIAWIDASAEFSNLDLGHLGDASALSAARLSRASLTYADLGYFSRRNHFCAQWLGSNTVEFVDRHISAVKDFLSARGIVPSKDLLSLYQKLVTQGGTFSVTSLPDSSWIPAEIAAYPREALLRQLNITARLQDAPPIMLRLAFAEPEAPLKVAQAPTIMPAAAIDESSSAQGSLDSPETTAATPVAVGTTAVAEAPALVETAPIDAVPAAEPAVSPVKVVAETVSNPVAADPRESVQDGELTVIASAPAPPKDSTLALVWKPGQIERLPPQPPKTKHYRVVPTAQLASLVNSEVRILTSSGKRVDGQVKQVLGDHVVLQIQVVQGKAELNVPLENIREVRIADPEAR